MKNMLTDSYLSPNFWLSLVISGHLWLFLYLADISGCYLKLLSQAAFSGIYFLQLYVWHLSFAAVTDGYHLRLSLAAISGCYLWLLSLAISLSFLAILGTLQLYISRVFILVAGYQSSYLMIFQTSKDKYG